MIVQVKWKAGERELPTFGVVNTGDTLPLPVEVANQYIAQGEAEAVPAVAAPVAGSINSTEED